jgi:hypothetical protein
MANASKVNEIRTSLAKALRRCVELLVVCFTDCGAETEMEFMGSDSSQDSI